MNIKKSISTLVAGVLLAASSANAACIQNPFHVGVSGGILAAFGDASVGYGIKIDPSVTNVAIVGGNTINTEMTTDSIMARAALEIGYVFLDLGFGINAEITYNPFSMEGSGAGKTNTFSSNMTSGFVNFEFRTAASSNQSVDSNVGMYISGGLGAVYFSNTEGAYNFELVDSTTPAGKNAAAGSFDDYSGYAMAANFKIGGEAIYNSSIALGVNLVGIVTFGDTILDSGTSSIPEVTAVTTPSAAPGAEFVQDTEVTVPTLYLGAIEFKFTYFMGGN